MSNEYPETMTMSNPYVTCYGCHGGTLQDGLNGPEFCYICDGNGVIRDRDDKGRFITHPYTVYYIGDGLYATKPPTQPKPNNGDNQ